MNRRNFLRATGAITISMFVPAFGSDSAHTKVKKAIAKLRGAQQWSFESYVASNRLEIRESRSMPTMTLRGNVIEYNPTFVDGLDVDRVVACILHETDHYLMSHWGDHLRLRFAYCRQLPLPHSNK